MCPASQVRTIELVLVLELELEFLTVDRLDRQLDCWVFGQDARLSPTIIQKAGR